jgi:hypothetical protein
MEEFLTWQVAKKRLQDPPPPQEDLAIAEDLQTETCGSHGRLLPQTQAWEGEEVDVCK